VNAEFVPVALKAALVNNPPAGEEGRLYREIGRSKPAPQGICVADSAGRALDWVLTFEDDSSVLGFLDHASKRFREDPDSRRAVACERYFRFPGKKLPDVAEGGEELPRAGDHPDGACPARERVSPGTVEVRLFGRALGADGQPVADATRQEHYVEDRFQVSPEAQERLARDAARAGAGEFPLPPELVRLLSSHAYLGQIDVNPLGSPAGGRGDLRRCDFRARRQGPRADGKVLLSVEGRSDVTGGEDASGAGARGDGRRWEHAVELAWAGFVELRGNRITRLLVLARGRERLRWGNASFPGTDDVARLPGGHPIDLEAGVRYGIIGEPAAVPVR